MGISSWWRGMTRRGPLLLGRGGGLRPGGAEQPREGFLVRRLVGVHRAVVAALHGESVDVLDAVGSNIRIDSRGPQVLRVLPRLNEAVNEEWISDKTRYAIDGLVRRRLDRPYVRREGRLREADWSEAFELVADRLKLVPGERIAGIAGDLCDAESMFALKELLTGA